jgi:hypothetical protein
MGFLRWWKIGDEDSPDDDDGIMNDDFLMTLDMSPPFNQGF